VILSGDYRTVPIFAVSSSGSFPAPGDTIDQGMAMMMDEALDHLIYTRDTVDLPTVPEDILALWTGSGLDAALPPPNSCDFAASNLSWVCEEQCETPSVSPGNGGSAGITIEEVGPLLTTVWKQRNPYNYYAPYMDCDINILAERAYGKALVGCVAVTMAQIIKYWEHPVDTRFRYNEMQDDVGTLATASLMKTCGDLVNMSFGCGSTNSNKAINALKNDLGYSSNADFRDYNLAKAKSDLLLERPVYLRGCRTRLEYGLFNIYKNCHAWVADGVRTTTTSLGRNFVELHMNWGWGTGRGNGWYFDFNNDSNPNDVRNYRYSKKMGVNISKLKSLKK